MQRMVCADCKHWMTIVDPTRSMCRIALPDSPALHTAVAVYVATREQTHVANPAVAVD